MAEQLKLPWAEGGYYGDWYRRLLDELGRVCTLVSLKEMAFACDSEASTLHQALAQRNDRQFQARWLGPFLHKATDLELARVLAEPGGVEVIRSKPMTPEEELVRLREAVSEVCGPMIAQAINQRVRR